MSATSGLDRVERLLTLVPWLSANPGVSLERTAREFSITVDQLEKDLWTLVVSGLPGHGPDQLIDIDFWDDGLIYVRDPQVLDVSMRLSPDESSALLVGLRLLAQVADAETRLVVQSAAGRIEAAVGDADSGVVVEVGALEVGALEDMRVLLDTARAATHSVTIIYGDATRDELSTRTIWPVRVFSVDDIGYVEAHCEQAGAMRTFRLDRIRRFLSPEDSPTPTTDSPVVSGAGHRASLDDSAAEIPVREGTAVARIRFEPAVAWAADLHRVQSREVAPDGSVLVWLPFHDEGWVTRWILSLGSGAVVEAPEGLRDAVREAGLRALRALGEDRA